MDHVKVLKRALQISWKYRALWLIGLLLVLAGGGVTGGLNNGSSSAGGGSGASAAADQWQGLPERWEDFPERWEDFPERWEDFPEQWKDLPEHWEDLPQGREWLAVLGPIAALVGALILILFALLVLLGVVTAIVRYVTRVSLIRMVDQYEETGTEVRFGAGFRMGWSRSAFRVFLINLAIKLPLALLMLLMIGVLVTFAVFSFINGSGPSIALGIVLILLTIPVSLLGMVLFTVAGPFIQVAHRVCVLEDVGAGKAIKSAFGLIRSNLGATALQWLLLVGLRIAWGIALIPVNLVLVFLGLVVAGLPGIAVALLGLFAGPLLAIVLGLLVFVPVFIVVVALPNLALTTAATIYHSTVWTLTYRELRAMDSGAEETEWIETKVDLDESA